MQIYPVSVAPPQTKHPLVLARNGRSQLALG